MRDLFDVLGGHACRAGGRPAFDDGATRLSYADLAARVAGAAEEIRSLPLSPAVVGILGGHAVESVVGLLGGWHAGKVMVVLPPFFTLHQLRHVTRDAGVAHILATPDQAQTAAALGLPATVLGPRMGKFAPPDGADGSLITYTSGSTGQPKGVVVTGAQMAWTATALARAIEADADDRYLSVLPLALLLETICAILVPILAGASVHLDNSLAANFALAEGRTIANIVATHRPTCMVLVPQLLSRWIAALAARTAHVPDTLRVVAVGGAPVPAALARQGWERGIPVYEGYGLSECGSVVALNRPGARKAGSVGKPLPGLEVRIEADEIVVRGSSVMERYLRGDATKRVWRTGDLGAIDPEGYLTVHGRRDNRIVTPLGRNISPEWIESLIALDHRVAHCLITHIAGPSLTAILVPSAEGTNWFQQASIGDLVRLVDGLCGEAPAYAVPRRFIVVPATDIARAGLMTDAGTLRRKETLAVYAAPRVRPAHAAAIAGDEAVR